MQGESPRCINCQGDHWANNQNCPMIVKQRTIVSLAAVENISIADARIWVEKGWKPSSSPSNASLRNNTNNFPNLPRGKEAYFENSNRFKLLGNEEPENVHRSHAEILKSQSQSQPQSQRNKQIYRRGNTPTTTSASAPTSHRYVTQPSTLQGGYDDGAHRRVLIEANGRASYKSGNGVAFSNYSSKWSEPRGTYAGKAKDELDFAELLAMATGIFSHFQNNNFTGALSDIFRLLKILGKYFFQSSSFASQPEREARDSPGTPHVINDYNNRFEQQQDSAFDYDYESDCNYNFRN
ncbi:hypothetical protein ALC57_14183 [Trachymyrmex cornetzi]|uniref:Uncharacterized protein n=1 Tax=Trachymyrmex cornetzi TaxID=471704 RepID=A0A151IYH7_9HYME|nr:hypothetical protein ALC57_14183 [Trachymyrmex cornetzi]